MQRLVKSGVGWRVGWHPHADKYQGLIGADHWAIELTQAEFNDFRRLLNQLVDTMNQMATEVMAEEKISCEAETNLLWMEVEGYPQKYSLRVILNCDRRCEGNWSENIAPQLLEALNSFNNEQ
ncbi:MAG: hypothetical protein RLZZ381_1895 [Cyanobacteriota bacterium]|jgi:hypothetical protein